MLWSKYNSNISVVKKKKKKKQHKLKMYCQVQHKRFSQRHRKRPLVKNNAWHVNCSLPLRSAQVSGDYGKVLCLDGTYIRPFSSSCEEKEDLCTSPLFFGCFHSQFQLSLLQSWHSRGKPENPKFLTLLHLHSAYLNRVLLFVCCGKFAITLRNIHLFVDKNTAEQGYLTFWTHAIIILLTLLFLAFICRATGSNDGKSEQRLNEK